MDACINKGAAQHQEAERTSDVFQTILTEVNLTSDIFLRIFLFSKSRKYKFIEQLHFLDSLKWKENLRNASLKLIICTRH